LPRGKPSAIRCVKCEGYGHEVYQCPNWDASPMTNQELIDYLMYLEEVERSVLQKLEVLKKVRRKQQAQREREKRERKKEL